MRRLTDGLQSRQTSRQIIRQIDMQNKVQNRLQNRRTIEQTCRQADMQPIEQTCKQMRRSPDALPDVLSGRLQPKQMLCRTNRWPDRLLSSQKCIQMCRISSNQIEQMCRQAV